MARPRASEDESHDEGERHHPRLPSKKKKTRTEVPSTEGEEPRAGTSREPSSEQTSEPGVRVVPGMPGLQLDNVSNYCI